MVHTCIFFVRVHYKQISSFTELLSLNHFSVWRGSI